MSPRPIVVGTDGSQASLRAVEWAAREAGWRGSPLRIVSAPAMPLRPRAYEAQATVANVLRGVAGRALGEAVIRAAEIAPGLIVDTDLLSGPPALAVPEAGSGASMLVVGTRGMGEVAAMVLGSVSRRAAFDAPCPVVVVREQSMGREQGMAIHREVVVGIRDPDNSSQALAFAFEEAALRDAALVAVHAWVPASLPIRRGGRGEPGGPGGPGDLSEEAASQLSRTLDGWRDKYPDVPVRQEVVNGHPAWELVGYTARAELVVLGRDDSPAATRTAGSILHTLLHHARGPIAIVPSGS